MKISAEKLDLMWKEQSKWREGAAKRQRYKDDEHDILKRSDKYADGSDKTNRVTGWIGYVVRRFTGTLTSIPYQVTNRDDESEGKGPEAYAEASELNSFPLVDVENFKNAFIKGHGIELHEFVDKEHIVRDVDPLEWMLIYDSLDALVGAVNMVTLEVNSVHNSEVLGEPLTLMVHYTDSEIVTFKRNDADGTWTETDTTEHEFGQVPVVVWRLNKARKSFLTDAILGQNDEYNETDSSSGDDIRNDTDALLLLPGVDGDWIIENSPVIRKTRVLPWDVDDSSLMPQYLVKNNDVTRIESRLGRTKMHIHVMADVPDVEQIVGATGAASGLALKLKFLPMIETASEMINWLKAGVRERIDLLNVVRHILGKDLIEDVVVTIQFSLPVARLEEWEKIGQLTGIVSHLKQLELLSDVDDPERELQRLEDEEAPAPDDGEGDNVPAGSNAPPLQQAFEQQVAAERAGEVLGNALQQAVEKVANDAETARQRAAS